MSAVRYMQQGLDFVHRAIAGAGNGLTAEQLHTVPDGESHSIAWVMWHGARVEDLIVQQVIKGEQSEWERGDWALRTGLPAQGFGTGQSTEEARGVRIGDVDEFLQYSGRVARLTDELLEGLSDEGLEREVKVGQRTETVGQSITLHLITHLNGHRGEVNLLRGMMGLPPVLLNQGG